MGKELVSLLLVILFVAALVRGDFAFTVLYLVFGAAFFGWWWSNRALKRLGYRRIFEPRAFLGEEVPVRLELANVGWLPLAWLHFRESLPITLSIPNAVNQVIDLKAHGRSHVDYVLHARKRGYYPIGPLYLSSGDILGLSAEQQKIGRVDYLTVYPLIVPFTHLKLPSRSPQGTLRHNQPIFEDPTRVLSKRDYVAGDSLRRVDWKATATTGRLQVKQFEPSIALETAIFLNLNPTEYHTQYFIDATELSIVIAASLANWVVQHKQTVGLVTNGIDPLSSEKIIQPILPRKGRGQLMRILDVLARVQTNETTPIADVLRRESHQLSWGTTIVLVTGQADEALFDELFQVRRRGQTVVLVIAGRVSGVREILNQAEHFGFEAYAFQNEVELDAWRR